MPDVVIENPVLNPPFAEPTRHFRFTDDGITDEVVPERRLAGYFVPIAQPKKRGKQLAITTACPCRMDRSGGRAVAALDRRDPAGYSLD